MYILDVTTTCSSPAIANVLSIIKTGLNIIQIIGPIIAIIATVINFTKLMTDPDNKKAKPALRNSVIALVVLFMTPFIVNLIMYQFDDTFDLAKCWTDAENAKKDINGTDYIPTNKKNPTTTYRPSPSDYEITSEANANSSGSSRSSSKLVFVGDSRTVGMQAAVNSDGTWSCKSSMGLSWLKSTGIPSISSQLTNGSALVILMGVNDLYNANNYISYINENANNWTSSGADVYFVSVNPTDNNPYASNSEIENFNAKLKSGLSSKVKYINTYDYLQSSGYSTTDGTHYDNSTYQKIYDYIKNNV